MENRCYLAMTAAEFQNCSSLQGRIAWMSCHFSSYGKGLSNLPHVLPPGSMLVLDDANPVGEHEPEMVLHQLQAAVKTHICSCILLDFQRSGSKETTAMAEYLTKGLSCPVAVSHIYAKELSCAVLLPPLLPDVPLNEYIQPWSGREIWLELAPSSTGCRVTQNGAQSFTLTNCPDASFHDKELCCHYSIDIQSDHVDFILHRTREDLTALMDQAEKLGITRFVGLWQEFGNI